MNKCGEAGEELKKIPKNESMLGMMDWKKHVSLNQYVQVLVLAAHKEKINMTRSGNYYAMSDYMVHVLEVFNDWCILLMDFCHKNVCATFLYHFGTS